MNTDRLIACAQRLHPLQGVGLRFRREGGMVGLCRLNALLKSNTLVRLDQNEDITMMAVVLSGDWGCDRNRNFFVYGLSNADEEMLRAILRDVEHVEQPEHPAKGIVSGREKKSREALGVLREAILTKELLDEADVWGLSLDMTTMEQEGFTLVCFEVKHGGETAAHVGVDAWSGRLHRNGALGAECYTDPAQLQQRIRELISDVADEITGF